MANEEQKRRPAWERDRVHRTVAELTHDVLGDPKTALDHARRDRFQEAVWEVIERFEEEAK